MGAMVSLFLVFSVSLNFFEGPGTVSAYYRYNLLNERIVEMKKLLMLSALAMGVGMPVAMAEGGPNGKGPGGRGAYMLQKLFQHHDADKDGVITKAEFLEVAEKRFAEMDADSDGKITKEEAKAHGQEMKEKFEKRREERRDRSSPPPAEEE